jgi:EmrB/QacA subfamily drug resistance transporter
VVGVTRNQRFVLLAAILGSFVAFLDVAVVNVALPAIEDELGGGIAAQQWVVDAYLLTLGSLILIAGSLSDLFGRKRVFGAGLIGFALASVGCAMAPNVPSLIAGRALQGIAGALLVPSSLALIIGNFPNDQQGRAIGRWTAWTGIAFVIGPLLGGLLVDAGSWRWVFAINVLPVAVTLAVLAKLDAEPAPTERSRVDVVGALLCAVALGGIIYALIEQPRRGWRDPAIFLPLGGGVAAFAGFLAFERATAHPLLPLALFRTRNFAVGNAATLAIYAGLTAATFLITVFLQQVAGYSATAAGLSLLPVTVIMFVLSPVFGRLAGKHGPRAFMAVGPIVAGAGFALMAGFDPHAAYVTRLAPGVVVFGVGLAATVAPLTSAVLADIDQRHAGIASAVNNAIARVAGLLAVAAVGAIVAAGFGRAIDAGADDRRLGGPARAFLERAKQRPLHASPSGAPAGDRTAVVDVLERASTEAMRAGLWAMAGLMVLGGVVSAIGISNAGRRRAPAPPA